MVYKDIDPRRKWRPAIIEAARVSPVLNAYLEYWRRGECTWEEAISACVLALIAIHEEQVEHIAKLLAEQKQPLVKVDWNFPPLDLEQYQKAADWGRESVTVYNLRRDMRIDSVNWTPEQWEWAAKHIPFDDPNLVINHEDREKLRAIAGRQQREARGAQNKQSGAV